MKSPRIIFLEGLLYMVIAGGSPFAEFLISDRVITSRSILAVSCIALVASANALKAFLSQSMKSSEPIEVKSPEGETLKVTETQDPKDT